MEKLPAPTSARAGSSSFTGEVLMEQLRGPLGDSRIGMAHVHFAPGARTHWHSHPVGQTLWGTDGLGIVATRSGDTITLAPGETVWIPADEEHWHGALPDRLMAHLAIHENDADGTQVTWLEPVTDQEYQRAAATALS